MLSLASIINIIVNLPSQTTHTQNFSLALLLSKNTVISTTDRVKSFSGKDDLIAAGFTSDSPEVAAAGLYFGQTPTPAKLLIGVQGTGETAVQALTACRAANADWYLVVSIGAVTADIEAMAAYVESASPAAVLFATTADADVKSGTAGNLCLTLQTAKYRRTLTQYSTFTDAVSAISGYVCGKNDGTEAFDLAFKTEVGVAAEAITSTDKAALDKENCNYYAAYQGGYNLFYPGNMADGTSFDEVLGIDMLTADIQSAVMSALTSASKISLTDEDISLVTAAIAGPCNAAQKRKFIAAGTWSESPVLKLNTGDALPNGYSIQAGSVSDLSDADRSAKKAPPIYVCVILANSARSFAIAVNVSR
jgi:hypothetical protein